MDRRTGRSEMHTRATQMQIVFRIAPHQCDAARRLGQHILDQRAREPEPPVIALNGP